MLRFYYIYCKESVFQEKERDLRSYLVFRSVYSVYIMRMISGN